MRWLLLLLLLLLLTGCNESETPHRATLLVFGTLVEISIHGAPPAEADAAVAAVQRELEAEQQAWEPWGDGELGKLNRALAEHGRGHASPELAALLARGRELAERSDGLFDPTIGGLVELWGFQHAESALPNAPPAPESLRAYLAEHQDWRALRVHGGDVEAPGLRLDLGGFAKGYAVDRALELLRERGITTAIVNAGGDLRALGTPRGRRWRIGIRDPRAEGVMATVEIDAGESVFTSGDYERYFDFDGHRYHHILDPRSGYPAVDVRSVTVIHDDATAADAAATALFVAGPEHWPETARRLGIKYVMLVDGAGRVHMNPEMAARMRFSGTPEILAGPSL